MEKNEKKLMEIKGKFEDFSVEVIKASTKVKKAEDSALSEKIKDNLENSVKLLKLSDYEKLNEEENQNILNNLDKELAVLGAFLDVACKCNYIAKEEYEKCEKFLKEFEALIQEK